MCNVCYFACLLFKHLKNRLPEDRFVDIISEAVEIECEFAQDSLPVELIGMNSSLMQQYIKFVADRLLVALDCSKIYKVSNPFEWMTIISVDGKTNFFEKRNSDYAISGVGVEREKQVFSLDEDF